jgi:hypothetical protein
MAVALSVLDAVRVASPCPVSWDSMSGDDRVRFCAHCHLHVFNLSGMKREQAEALVRKTDGRLCVRFYKRADGGVMTRDCPEGQRKWLQRMVLVLGMMFASAWMLLWGAFFSDSSYANRTRPGLRGIEPFHTILNWIEPTPRVTMGAICPPLRSNGAVGADPAPKVDDPN